MGCNVERSCKIRCGAGRDGDGDLRVDAEGAVVDDVVVRDCGKEVRGDENVVASCFGA